MARPGYSETPQEILEKAFQSQQRGDYDAAIQGYEHFLSLVTPHPNILVNLGAAYAAKGNLEKAAEAYRRALQLQPDFPAARLNLGLAYYKSADYPRAVEQFLWIKERQPDNLRVAVLLGDSYTRLGMSEDVIKTLLPFRSSTSEDPAIAYLLGTALIQDGQLELGQQLVDEILRTGESAEAHLMMSFAYRSVGNIDSAIEEARRAIELEPDLVGAHSLLGQLYLAIDGRDQIQRNPLLLGEVRLEGVGDLARQAFEKELERNPNEFDALLILGYILKEEGEYDRAQTYLERASLLRPAALHVTYHLAALLLAKGDPGKASELLSGVVASAPDFKEAHMLLAVAYHRLGMKDAAARERQIILQLTEREDSG